MSAILTSLIETRLLMHASRAQLARHRGKLWRQLQATLHATPALRPHVGKALDEIPIVTPEMIRADYGQWNSLGLSHEALHAAAQAAEDGRAPSGDIACGYSTGTSGKRGLFVTTGAERADYIGQSLARLLPLRALLKQQRIALILRAGNSLYTDVSKTSRFSFQYFPLDLAEDDLVASLQSWQPTILIAPAHKLVALAQAQKVGRLALSTLTHCYYGSEPMGGAEVTFVGDVLGVEPRAIYQATEGFIAASCRYGRVHLNEHSFEVSKQPVDGTHGWQPIVTDLRRTSQPIVHLCLDDFVEDDFGDLCPCNYGGRTIMPVMGRVSDLWWFDGRVLTPRQVTNVIESLVEPACAWQAIGSPQRVVLRLDATLSREAQTAVAAGLKRALSLPCAVEVGAGPPSAPAPKRRRVIWQGGQTGG
jgi:putative adenylate-forming enzyme